MWVAIVGKANLSEWANLRRIQGEKMSAAASMRWLPGKSPILLATAGLIALSIAAGTLNARLVQAKLQAQRSNERAVRAEDSLARLEKELAARQRKVDELTARLTEMKNEYERAFLRYQARESALQDGAYANRRRPDDAKRAKMFARCREIDNPLCGINP